MGELYIVLELNRNGMKAEKSEGALLSELPAPRLLCGFSRTATYSSVRTH